VEINDGLREYIENWFRKKKKKSIIDYTFLIECLFCIMY
jgi:hypothetical protein